MTTEMKTISKAQAKGFTKLRAARNARMYCKRYPLLIEAAAAYRAAGDAIVADSLLVLAEIKNFNSFRQVADAR